MLIDRVRIEIGFHAQNEIQRKSGIPLETFSIPFRKMLETCNPGYHDKLATVGKVVEKSLALAVKVHNDLLRGRVGTFHILLGSERRRIQKSGIRVAAINCKTNYRFLRDEDG